MSDLTCGTCQHWHKREGADVNNIGAPKRGDCRYGPPHTTTIPGPNGQMATFSSYPSLPENFPACSLHAAQLELA